jgi:hypothetical protein
MVAAFNRQKRAFAAANTSYRKTGTLDLSRIASYKTSEDIFISKTTQAVGQSHAVYLLIDISASMRGVIGQVAMQYYITTLFLKRANIPFTVTTFTTTDGLVDRSMAENGEFFLGHTPLLQEIATHDMSVSELQDVFNNLSMLAYASELRSLNAETRRYCDYLANEYPMAGTPLIESMTYVYAECVKMKRKCQVDNITLLLISDGVGSSPRVVNNNVAFTPSAVTCPFTGRIFSAKSFSFNCRFISVINEMMNSQGISTQCVFIHDGLSSVRKFMLGISSGVVNEKQAVRDGNCKGMAGFDHIFFIHRSDYPKIDDHREFLSDDTDNQTAKQIAKSILSSANQSSRLKSLCDIFVSDITKSSKKMKKVV